MIKKLWIFLAVWSFSCGADLIDDKCSASQWEARSLNWIEGLISFTHGYDQYKVVREFMKIRKAEMTGLSADHSLVAEANQGIVNECKGIDNDGDIEIHHMDAFGYLWGYFKYRDSDYLYAETKEQLLDGNGNPDESMRFFQDLVFHSNPFNFGLGDYNPWPGGITPYEAGGTWNHKLQWIACGLLLSQIYSGETYSAPDGTFDVKNSSETIDDYYHYFLNAFMEWLTAFGHWNYSGPVNFHLRFGPGEKDSHYSQGHLGDLLIIREAVDEEWAKKYAEMMADLILADYASENLRGLYTGAHARHENHYTELRSHWAEQANSYLFFDNQFYDPSSCFGYGFDSWGTAALVTGEYNPSHPEFPRIFTDMANSFPEEGYFIRECFGTVDTEPDVFMPEATWIKPDYALGFRLRNNTNREDIPGGLWINSPGGTEDGIVIGLLPSPEPEGHRPRGLCRGVLHEDCALMNYFNNESGDSDNGYAFLFYSGGMDETDFSDSRWMFFRNSSESGKDVYSAVGVFSGSHSYQTSAGGGTIRKFTEQWPVTIWEVSDSDRHASFSAFKTDVKDNAVSVSGNTYTYTSCLGDVLSITPPEPSEYLVNGSAVNWEDFRNCIGTPWGRWPVDSMYASFSKDGRSAFYDFDPDDDNVFYGEMPVKQIDNTPDQTAVEASGAGSVASLKPGITVSPNPFNPSAVITVSGIYADAGPRLRIYDSRGRMQVVAGRDRLSQKSSSEYRYTWDASGVPAGVYVVRVKTGEKFLESKMILMR
ncbi:MAG: T9SS type A sorting domain-containing protein [Fibrobacterota bacterium]